MKASRGDGGFSVEIRARRRYAAKRLRTADALGAAAERARLADALEAARLDSLVTIMYRARGSLRSHVDHGLPGLGLTVSLGAPACFRYGGRDVLLRSGDVLCGAFGDVEHSVVATRPLDEAPAWWRSLPAAPSAATEISRFGRARCSLQIRQARAKRRTEEGS